MSSPICNFDFRISKGLLIMGRIGVCLLLLMTIPAMAQQPDPNGWAGNGLVPNQPVSISQSTAATVRGAANLPASIRSQIGLATLESDAKTELPSPKTNSTWLEIPRLDASEKKSLLTVTAIPEADTNSITNLISSQTEQLTSRDGIQSSLKVAILLAALSLAPALVLMTTCYIRVVVVLSLLKQAFGGQQLPPTQVVTALSLFLTFLIMTPVWNEVKTTAIDPYAAEDSTMSWDEAWQRGVVPIKNFMVRQIELADNEESVAVFYKYLPETGSAPPTMLSDVPLNVLLPAFMVSELKVAFLLGFQIFLPFLVLDLVVSSVTVSMGMVMLPPNMVSFPLKLILFVMVDGWNLVIGMLLQSFGSG